MRSVIERWRALSKERRAAHLLRITIGAFSFLYGASLINTAPVTGTVLVIYERAGAVFNLYCWSMVVGGLIMLTHWQLRLRVHAICALPVVALVGYAGAAAVVGAISLQGLLVWVLMIALIAIALWRDGNEFH